MALKIGVAQMVADAEKEIETLSIDQALAAKNDPDVLFVDLRDVRELRREGRVPGAKHCPRGMLEFWVDPDSKYFDPDFGAGKKLVFFCAMGWRSALATQTVQRMGLEPVAHIDGGFTAWKDAGGAIEMPEPRA
ncbi:rhodanese-like domain-containing protein [Denitrobaculum tricleocarpae]|uniref:Rhodanese-like domain-containing protein n=1 Tax=Denitrobaculum tricleocarpae TaxID=2591009 RepID=A0A545TQX8_9PROT|nr:rhodanese-like domain-containing protein [Denitrobaculum tricleocarpae]TQV79626.1 rhodanese-like domain-containing protein [Denitrobaculum tricleocarpae]